MDCPKLWVNLFRSFAQKIFLKNFCGDGIIWAFSMPTTWKGTYGSYRWTLKTSHSFIWYILLDQSREDSTLWPPAQTGRSKEACEGWSKGAEREMLSPMLDCHQQGDEGSDRTMILLYGAGGGPGRGGRPMDSIRSRASDDFPLRV